MALYFTPGSWLWKKNSGYLKTRKAEKVGSELALKAVWVTY